MDSIQSLLGIEKGPLSPSTSELLLRAALASAPPRGQLLVPNTFLGRTTGGLLRLGEGLGGQFATELGQQRLARGIAEFARGVEGARFEPGGERSVPGLLPESQRFPTEEEAEAANVPAPPQETLPNPPRLRPEAARPTFSFSEFLGSKPPELQRLGSQLQAAGVPIASLFSPTHLIPVTERGVVGLTGGQTTQIVAPEPSETEKLRNLQIQAEGIFEDFVSQGVQSGKYKTRHEAEVGVANDNPQLVKFFSDAMKSRLTREPPALTTEMARAIEAKVEAGEPLSERELHALNISDPARAKTVVQSMRKIREQERIDTGLAMTRALAAFKQAEAAGAYAKGMYLTPEGEWANPTNEELRANPKGFIPIKNAQQQNEWAGVNTARVHVEQTLGLIDSLSQSGVRPTAYLKAKLGVLKNDPNFVVLFEQLSALTPLALGRAMTGTGSRGGFRLAQFLQGSGVTEGDTVEIALRKMRTIATIARENAATSGLPTTKFDEQIRRINATLTGKTSPLAGPKVQGPPPPWER